MNYLAITKNDMLNGDGLRVVLWVAGCSHECEGCHNPHTHNPNSGELFTDKQKYEIFQELAKDHISGITFSGGDPLHPNNRTEVIEFAKEIKETFPDQTIWLYTGYRFESILRSSFAQILDYVDVMVDGR